MPISKAFIITPDGKRQWFVGSEGTLKQDPFEPHYTALVLDGHVWLRLTPSYWNVICWDDADVNGPERIMSMIDKTYEKRGGYFGRDTMLLEASLWYVDDVRDPKAVFFAKHTPFGHKLIGAAALDQAAKLGLSRALVALFNRQGWYAELSGGVERILARKCPVVAHEADIKRVLGGKTVIMEALSDMVNYRREVHGQMMSKVMIGRPNL